MEEEIVNRVVCMGPWTLDKDIVLVIVASFMTGTFAILATLLASHRSLADMLSFDEIRRQRDRDDAKIDAIVRANSVEEVHRYSRPIAKLPVTIFPDRKDLDVETDPTNENG